MKTEVDKEFVINILTNNALNELKMPDALKILTGKVRESISAQIEATNETELASLYESLKKAVEEKQSEE